MLTELRIQNFAIIDQLDVQFAPGFNVITGETGAGKSIIVDAVELLLGGRADIDFVRAGSEKAVVEGIFKLSSRHEQELRPLLEVEHIELDRPDELVMTREMRSNGRHVCRLNGSTVNLQYFREIAAKLVDIHGQSEHLSLLDSAEHIVLLDRYAGVEEGKQQVAALVEQLHGVRGEINSLEQDKAALERRADMLRFQIDEIRAVNPQPGEEAELSDESLRLSNADQLVRLTSEVQAVLDGEDDTMVSAIQLLNQVEVLFAKLTRIDPKFEEQQLMATSLAEQTADLAQMVQRYAEHVEHDPQRLNDVEDRLDALNRLKRKYGNSIEDVLSYYVNAQEELEGISNSSERLEELRVEEDKLLHQIGELAVRLSNVRRQAAVRLGKGIESELADLKMEGTHFEVSLSQTDDPHGCYVGDRRLRFDETGIDDVEFLMAANRGEPLRSLSKVASGGETARIMLALKGVLSRADETPTLIFDEIDQGIGGRVGSTVGQKLWRLTDNHQVLCITHLAQLAGFGDAHYKVMKGQRGDRTVTTITPLNDRARVDELAEMLGAETTSAKQSAHDILMLARRIKEGNASRDVQTAML
ncbi:MAG: DNA repair protein RecN [Anaerolineae bacterium]|nr:DNA repair protein RecN [Anaerolineae bacterium]